MGRIAAAFGVQAPIHLVKEFDNVVIFPHEGTGRFNPSSLSPGSTYDVQGQVQSSPPTPGEFSQQVASPFGSYPASRFMAVPSAPVPHPPSVPPKFNRRVIKKTILLASLSTRDMSRPSSSKINSLTYNVVTNLIVSIDSTQCNVTAVADLVRKQVGFEVALLDSKLFPIFESEASSSSDFWKSTRKIIAASKALYDKLGGISPELNVGQFEGLDPPSSKRSKIGSDKVPVEDILAKWKKWLRTFSLNQDQLY